MSSKLNIPIFPLNGAIFFPDTNLPLNIFEERYLKMVDFALANQKKIGMIQIKNDKSFYSIGCVGKISSYDETEDGRYLINLVGLNYFVLGKEILPRKKFKIHEINISNKKGGYLNEVENFNYDLLVESYTKFIKKKNLLIDCDMLKKIEKSLLIKFIAMSSPFSVEEKQMLLETFNLNELAKKIIGLLDYHLSEEESKMIN